VSGIFAGLASGQPEAPVAEDVLSAAIARHDPDGVWATGAFRLAFEESRPDGSIRETEVLIDHGRGRFEIDSERAGRSIRGELGAGYCRWLLDGSSKFSDEEREELRLTCDRLEWIRNYYLYLWGLPMKLRDPGTLVEPSAKETSFEGREALEVRITYEEEVGSDVWYFYFDPQDRALIGYRFYHDEAANDGEFIVLEGLERGAGLVLPRQRTWYTHQGRELLGTDVLVKIELFAAD
jgi:hypothetical protein